MRLTIIAGCLIVGGVLAPRLAEAQVSVGATPTAFSDREYWQQERFGSDDFWREYVRWYGLRPLLPTARVDHPYYTRPVDPPVDRFAGSESIPHTDVDYVNPRLRGYDPDAGPYVVRRPYTARELSFSPDASAPMDLNVSRWPAYYRDYHDFYRDGGYPATGYFWPASGLGPRPLRSWR